MAGPSSLMRMLLSLRNLEFKGKGYRGLGFGEVLGFSV